LRRARIILFDFLIRIDYYVPHISAEAMRDTMIDAERVVATNRKARHEYFLLETFEAGIALKGTEVKSLRDGRASLQESYATIKDGEAWIIGMHISPYERAAVDAHDPTRTRKLLLHKREIRRLVGKLTAKGLTLIPTRIYFKDGIAKVEIAIAKGKRSYDKREAIKEREARRELKRRVPE
jgi:SsrA-binding protein